MEYDQLKIMAKTIVHDLNTDDFAILLILLIQRADHIPAAQRKILEDLARSYM